MDFYHRNTLDQFYNADSNGLPYFDDNLTVEMIRSIEQLSLDDLVVIFALQRPNIPSSLWDKYLTEHWVTEVPMPPFFEGLLARSNGILIFKEQSKDILRGMTGWSNDRAIEVQRLMAKKHTDLLCEHFKEFCRASVLSQFCSDWVLRNGEESLQELWDYLVDRAADLISYKFCLTRTIHSYQVAYNITHG